MNSIQYQGAPVFYQATGAPSSLPTLVLLHGFLEDSRMWNGLVKRFEKLGEVVRVDLPGHGQSGNLSEVHSMEDVADAIRKVIDVLGLKKPVILGHSMGGYVALAYAELYDNLSGLGLFFSTPHADSPARKIMREKAEVLVLQNRKSFIRAAIPQLFSAELRTHLSEKIAQQIEYSLEMGVEGVIAAIHGMKIRADRTRLLFDPPKSLRPKKIGVFAGESDTVIPIADVQEWIDAPGIGYKFISTRGHMGHLSDTENCATAVLEWWSTFQR
ncbi:MAG TPA: alpha/beta hydrolase [Cryomorphaceae bacterium]|nr:alpha/beta hydrolase [Cryomorphaceae bacterium]|tara:strand:+ start:434 stop:1246 length:813 start_codon:yes stop_codon:yes gene_type:complete